MFYIILISIFVIIIMFFLLNYLYKRTNYYKNIEGNISKFLKKIDSNIELASFGSSYTKYGIVETLLPMKAFNFGIQPESLNYDYKLLKMYTKNLKENCIVLINLPNFVFTFVDYEPDISNNKYYYFLDKKYINNYKKYKYYTRIKYPILGNPLLLRYVLKDQRKNDYDTRIDTKLDETGVLEEAKIRIKDWNRSIGIVDLKSSEISKKIEGNFIKTRKILEDMINYCIENGFRPVIVVPPVSNIMTDLISKDLLKKCLYDNINLANKKNIPVFDYLYRDELKDYKLYINADFMNLKGRKIFTETIINDLKEINMI